jgi:3-methyladenine DNA glycosylase Tag
MQACGLVNDHLLSCYRYAEIQAIGRGATAG